MHREVNPDWWRSDTFQGRPMRDILHTRDITAVFQFLKTRGFSRASIAAAVGLSENRVREIIRGRQHVTSYEVLERIATSLDIDRGLMGLAYTDPTPPAHPNISHSNAGVDRPITRCAAAPRPSALSPSRPDKAPGPGTRAAQV
jgi:transcriptional regulator with XRE-family HTH domain